MLQDYTRQHLMLEDLEDLEAEEYKKLTDLREIYQTYLKENNKNECKRVDSLIDYQRGRWGMVVDIIEKVKGIK